MAEPALIRGRNQIAGQSKQHKFLTKPNGCGDHFGSSFPGLRMSSLICEKTCLNCYQVFFPKWYTHCQAIIYTIYHSPSISIPSQVITYLSLSINIYPYLSISIHIYLFIVDLPIRNGGPFHVFFYVDQRFSSPESMQIPPALVSWWWPAQTTRAAEGSRGNRTCGASSDNPGWGNHPNFGVVLSIKQNGDMCMYMYI